MLEKYLKNVKLNKEVGQFLDIYL